MSLYDKSSLLQVPSLYKDGTLVSTIPEDRSGDFTVVRGSNLSATRIGPDGYIKKGYENLLLQSNSFLTSPWSSVRASVIGGQAGYDGTNDAWLLGSTALGQTKIQVSNSASGVNTISFYAKAGTANYAVPYMTSTLSRAWFNLSNGTIESSFNNIDTSIESVGNGWYRCSMSFNGSATNTWIELARTDNLLDSEIGDNIYIQDAQINQGLVAYPYLETTDAPAQGGLLENTPRLDWSNGVPAVLVEEGRTNLLPQTEYYDGWPQTGITLTTNTNETLSPEGLYNASKLVGNGTTGVINSGMVKTGSVVASVYLKSVSGSVNVTFKDPYGGLANEVKSVTTEWQRFDFIGDNGFSFAGFWVDDIPASGIYMWGAQLEQGSTPSSYIPTYGTSQTRSNETVSDTFSIPTTATIYNSFYSDVAEQVYVLDQVFNVSVGLNKVAIAFSPTAVKISVGGSIVANATGTYDTTSLTNIQLGSNNGTDYSNAPISGFYVFPEFLTDEELNSLTD